MDALLGREIDPNSFAFLNAIGEDRWAEFTPVFGSLTVVGALAYYGRHRFVGRKYEFQVKFSAATSIASAAGTDYLTLPVVAVGYAGMATMTNSTTNVAVGVCHVKVTAGAAGRVYLPAQVASANVFLIAGWCEV